MKNTKKLVAVLMAVILMLGAVSLASCGKTETGENENKTTDTLPAGDDGKDNEDGKATSALPIVCGETGMNSVCGVATYGVDYYNLGVKAGDMAADILLDGADVSAMPVQTDPNPALSVSQSVADEIGFKVPDTVLEKASGGSSTLSVERVDSAIVSKDGDFTVGILQLVQHVALDLSNKGFQDQLSARMAAAGKTVTILDENAAGDQANNTTIAETFVSKKVDLIYTIATSSSQAAAAATTEIPVLFCAVTDPVSAGLVDSMDVPGGNVSGVSDINPVADQIDLIAELLGKEDIKIGLLYTSSEANSVFQIDLAKKECDAKGYAYEVKGIGDINDIEAAFVALRAAGVDAIYIPTDNVLANGASNIHSINLEG